MRLAPAFTVLGRLARPFSLAFLPPLAVAIAAGQVQTSLAFATGAVVAYVFGTILAHASRGIPRTLRRPEALLVVATTWLLVAGLAAVPYLIVPHGLSPVEAFFEAMSGLTTTGATILQDFSRYDDAFFLWRAMTQWFGGLGVIALFLVVLPRLGIAGRQMFFAESSGAPGEGISTSVRRTAQKLWLLYTALTLLLAVLLVGQGFSAYDGVVHALTTMSAGGFSPHPRSIEGYANGGVEWILVGFMILAGSSYALQWRALTRGPLELARDGEFVLYVGACLVLSLLLSVVLAGGIPGEASLRTAAFQVASLASSTGFASADYANWSAGAKSILFAAMLLGGCAGSAAGGPKVVRWLIATRFLGREMRQALHPRAVMSLAYKGRQVPPSVLRSVLALLLLFLAGYFFLGLFLVVVEGTSMQEGFSSAIACMGNIGPGLGRFGPMGSFAEYSAPTQFLLALAMWCGRLELVTVFALLGREAWRGARWSDPASAAAPGMPTASPASTSTKASVARKRSNP